MAVLYACVRIKKYFLLYLPPIVLTHLFDSISQKYEEVVA